MCVDVCGSLTSFEPLSRDLAPVVVIATAGPSNLHVSLQNAARETKWSIQRETCGRVGITVNGKMCGGMFGSAFG